MCILHVAVKCKKQHKNTVSKVWNDNELVDSIQELISVTSAQFTGANNEEARRLVSANCEV